MTNPAKFIVIALLLIALVGAFTSRGFASSNTVGESAAGDGSAAISGYTLSNIAYTPLNGDAGKLASLAFTTAPAAGAGPAGTVFVSLDAGTTWVACTNVGGSDWSCSFPGGSEPSISSLNSLRVVAGE